MSGRVAVGVIGAGSISASYLGNMRRFPDLDVVAVGDLDADRAAHRAAEFGVALSGDPALVLGHPDVEIVVNLTIPAAHADVSLRALAAGKHVWSEKPIGVSRAEATAILAAADAAGLRVAVAPDTLLGPGMQTARRVIARGDIGRPLSAQTLFQTAGPQRGHPDPEFLFQPGAGPLFDFGPYYFSALVTVLGSARRVAALGAQSQATRVVGSGPKAGQEFPVRVPTNVGILTEFAAGGIAQSVLSFDAQLQRQGFIEIYGSEGTLAIPDPNAFGGPIRLTQAPAPGPFDPDYEIEWTDIPHADIVTGRGLGVLDLARSIREDRPHVASGTLGAHVLDILVSCAESMAGDRFVDLTTTAPAVPILPEDFDPFAQTL